VKFEIFFHRLLGASCKCKSKSKTSSALRKSARKRTAMANEMHANNVFKIENCRAKIHGAGDLVDCLSPEQAQLCNCSLFFGSVYFCKHPRRNEIIEITEKLRSKIIFPQNVSQSDNQEQVLLAE